MRKPLNMLAIGCNLRNRTGLIIWKAKEKKIIILTDKITKIIKIILILICLLMPLLQLVNILNLTIIINTLVFIHHLMKVNNNKK
jgi:hypothetical protein